jgi:hypothetical protein
MLRMAMIALAVAFALGSPAFASPELSTSAFARGGSAAGGERLSGLDRGPHRYGRRDVWGHSGNYYGPMIHGP